MALTSLHSISESTLVRTSEESVGDQDLPVPNSILSQVQTPAISNLSTGIPINFGTVFGHRTLLSFASNIEVLQANSAVTEIDPQAEHAARITYVVNVHTYDKLLQKPRLASGNSGTLDIDCWYDLCDGDGLGDCELSGSPVAEIQMCCITRNQLIQQAALNEGGNHNTTSGEHDLDQHGQINIVVDKTVALRYAALETTAVKNRIILIGLTLTIPLFLYLRFTIWN